MLIASVVPEIVCHRAGAIPPLWIPLVQTALLVAGAVGVARSERFRKLAGFFLALGALRFAWFVLVPLIEESRAFQSYGQHLSWGAQMFVGRLLPVLGAFLMVATLLGSGIGRRDLFCAWEICARQRNRSLFSGSAARSRGHASARSCLSFSASRFRSSCSSRVHPDFSRASRLWTFLPWCLATPLIPPPKEFIFPPSFFLPSGFFSPQKRFFFFNPRFFLLPFFVSALLGFPGFFLGGVGGGGWGDWGLGGRGGGGGRPSSSWSKFCCFFFFSPSRPGRRAECLLLADERIRAPLLTDGGGWSVAGQHRDVVAEWK